MKNSKKLFLIVLSVLAVAFISCKSNEEPDSQGIKPNQLVGTWNDTDGQGLSFTFSDTGEIDFGNGSKTTITDWDTNKDAEYYGGWELGILIVNPTTGSQTYTIFNFTSSSDCKVSFGGNSTVNFKKS